ncbi:hypothetical protein JCM3765_006938 [Sporobolomyces pararoseus]
MVDQLPRGLRSRSPTPPQTVSSPSHLSPRTLEQQPQEAKPSRQSRADIRVYVALVANSYLASDLLEKLSKRPSSTILSFPLFVSTSLLLLTRCVRRRRDSWEEQEGVLDVLKRTLRLGRNDQEAQLKVWATGASLVLSLTLRIWSLRFSNTLEAQAVEVHVLSICILLLPHFSQMSHQETRRIGLISVAVSVLVSTSLVGNSVSKLGMSLSLLRIPIEAVNLVLLRDGLSEEDEGKSEEFMLGSTVVATLLSLLPLSLVLFSETSSETSTFSPVAFLLSSVLPLATICFYVVFLVLLSGTLIFFSNPALPVSHLIPRNFVTMVATVPIGTSGNWLQLLAVYSSGTAVIMNLIWHKDGEKGKEEEDHEKPFETDTKPHQLPPKFIYLSFVPLLIFTLSAFIPVTSHSLPRVCSHLTPSLRPHSCPSRVEALPSKTVDLVVSYYDENVVNTRQNLDYIRKIPFVVERQSRVVLYNKGEKDEETLRGALGLKRWDRVIKLENVGREGATYLQHIIRNYNYTLSAISASLIPSNPFATSSTTASSPMSFADHTFFLQPHLAWSGIAKPRLWTIPSDVGFASFGPLRLAINGEDEGHGTYPFVKTIHNIFRGTFSPPEGSVISWSAQFLTSRRRIMANSYASYRELDDMIEAPADHYLHHLWGPDNSGGPSNPTFGHSVERSWPIIFDCSDAREIAVECFDSDAAGLWHKCLSLRRLDRIESQAIEIFILPSLVLLYPSIARPLTASSKEYHHQRIEIVTAGIAFFSGLSLLGGSSSSNFGLTCSLLRTPLEAACIGYLNEGITREEEEERIEWMFGSTFAAASLSALLLILITPLLSRSSFSLTFSPVSWLKSLATVLSHNIYFVFLLFALHTFSSPILPASHVIPRNAISLIVSLAGGGLSSLRGNQLQLFATYLGGSGALSVIFRRRQQNSHEGGETVCVDPSEARPHTSPLVYLSFLSLAIFILSSTFSRPTPSLLSSSCALLPPSLRSYSCPSIQPLPTVDVVIAYWNESLSYTRRDLDYVRRITFVNERDSRIVVYNKGEKDEETLRGALGLKSWDKVVKLENVGREGATYLQHILMNYNDTLKALSPKTSRTSSSIIEIPTPLKSLSSLSTERKGFADHTLFLQYHLAWTGISKPRLWTIPSNVGYASFGPLHLSHCGNETGTEHHPLLATVYNIFREKLCPSQGILIAWSAQHIVSARRILSNDYSKYQTLSRMIEAPEGEWIHQLRDPFGELGDPSNPAFGHVLERSWPLIFDCADVNELSSECRGEKTGLWKGCFCRDN